MGNSTFKRTFQSHLDPDEIQTESKWSIDQAFMSFLLSLEAHSQYSITYIYLYKVQELSF